MCDKCEKWRFLPPHVDLKTYEGVDQYCSMNVWDHLRNNCDAAEQKTEPVATTKNI